MDLFLCVRVLFDDFALMVEEVDIMVFQSVHTCPFLCCM